MFFVFGELKKMVEGFFDWVVNTLRAIFQFGYHLVLLALGVIAAIIVIVIIYEIGKRIHARWKANWLENSYSWEAKDFREKRRKREKEEEQHHRMVLAKLKREEDIKNAKIAKKRMEEDKLRQDYLSGKFDK